MRDTGKTRVVILSSATLFREGIKSMLEDSGAVTVVAATASWEALPSTIEREQADAVVIDRDDTMPEQFVDQLFAIAPHMRVVLVSSQDNRLAIFTQSGEDEARRPQLIAAVARP
jgi:DNA-binding NarL/FixJ family response regulator